ncbi:MAG: CPBP family intramembrane glutamic endopeptidase [Bacteroidota bacterium]
METYYDKQYSLLKILLIWFLATAPMFVMAYWLAPAVGRYLDVPDDVPAFLVFWPFMILGLVWQFILSLIIVYREYGNIRWTTIRKRMWYNLPKEPTSGRYNKKLFLWAIPFIVISIGSMFIVIPDVLSILVPASDNLPQYNLNQFMSPEYKGAWWLFGLVLLTIPFNYFLGEEFLFRGILLPKMRGVFGKSDWFFNGVIFAFYHLHKPHGILHQVIFAGFILAFPARRFRSNWMAVIIHGIEGLIAIIIVLSIIL